MSTTQLSPSGPLSIVYCSDEDILIRDPNDFLSLAPHSQSLASGTDGFIGASTPWKLSSRSADFVKAGVKPKCVVLLTAPTAQFPGGGIFYAVDVVSTNSLDLRGIGQLTAAGDPPGIGVNMTGVSYKIPTYGPQIEAASYSLNQNFHIDPTWFGRRPEDLYDLRELRDACALTVICDELAAAVTGTGNFPLIKLQTFEAKRDVVRGRLQLRWCQTDTTTTPPTNLFSTRIVR